VAVGLLTLEVFLPDSHTLKDKRSLLRPLLARVRREWNVAAAEVGEHREVWQRATLAVATVNTDAAQAHATLEAVAGAARAAPGLSLLDYSTQIL